MTSEGFSIKKNHTINITFVTSEGLRVLIRT